MTTLNKLLYPPEQQGYSVESSADAVTRIQLDGGAGRYRQDLFGVSDLVTCSWILDPQEYNWFKAFYRVHSSGSIPFLAELIVDSAELQEYECRIMPGTFKLDQQQGFAYFVSAVLECVAVNEPSSVDDDNLMYISALLGPDYFRIFTKVNDMLHLVTNIRLPKDFK